ncbi:MAG: hypothetical protein IPO73_18725 [Gemmatimonadetes bacterium]|nr:hypothetical protein [Gemmatimonadota bacterium]
MIRRLRAWASALVTRLRRRGRSLPALPPVDDEIVLGGRRFVPVAVTTFEHDIWMMAQVQAAGLHDLRRLFAEGRGVETIAEDLLQRIWASGRTLHLLAGTLTEKGQPWSPALAEELVLFFGARSDPEEKALLQAALVRLLLGLFVSGAESSATFPSSSAPTIERPAVHHAPAGAP